MRLSILNLFLQTHPVQESGKKGVRPANKEELEWDEKIGPVVS